MTELISGALVALSLVAGLFFLRFWKKTHDRFFAFFAEIADRFARNVFDLFDLLIGELKFRF